VCDDGYATIALDSVGGAVAAVLALAGYEASNGGRESAEGSNVAVIGGSLVAIVLGISAAVGETHRKDCQNAKTAWRMGGAVSAGITKMQGGDEAIAPRLHKPILNPTNDPAKASTYWCSSSSRTCVADEAACVAPCRKSKRVWCSVHRYNDVYTCSIDRLGCVDRRSGSSGECVAQTAKLAEPVEAIEAPIAQPRRPVEPRGFYCAASPTVDTASMCAREKLTCEQARGMAVGAVSDLTECTLTEHAYCFGDRCFATAKACDAQRGEAVCELR
jgi:hypothetical protein